MASYIIPKIGQKVKVSYEAWSKCYPGMTTFDHCNDIGIITEIKYPGFRLEDADYKHCDTIYTVTFLPTIFEEERHVYCRYDDLFFNPMADTRITYCAKSRYESPNVDCCGNVRAFEKFINRIFGLPDDGVKEKDPLIKTVKTSEKEKKTMDFRVKKIMHNGPATIVFWEDNTKTVVRLKEGDRYDPYAAFTAAVTKRLYGKTMKISEIVDRYSKDLKKIDIPETPPRELTVEELKAAAEKLGYRVSKKPKK